MQRFNPRARMGRDSSSQRWVTIQDCFNPRARMGRDIFISILFSCVYRFNPRARMGRDAPHRSGVPQY